jgi:diadenosine tetraphosphatase ApaH/serine/threonine PP2A family protein phosphatase
VQYGIISDIHGNLEALEAVLSRLNDADGVFCLGDVVGYGPNPNECIERVTSLPGLVCVAGNHDLAAIGRYDHDWFNSHARAAIRWTQERLTDGSRRFLEGLPLTARVDDATLVHGALPEPMDYVTGPVEALATFQAMETPICFIGHTHVAEYYCLKRAADSPTTLARLEHRELTGGGEINIEPESRYLINCGGVGQPRDGNPLAAFGIYDSQARLATMRRTPYPVEKVQAKMAEAGLPLLLIERLSYGR